MDMFHWAGPASVANLPAAVAPVMLTDAGLPTGVQIVAAEGAGNRPV
jgi:amidase